jgi:hypothetical protein
MLNKCIAYGSIAQRANNRDGLRRNLLSNHHSEAGRY